MPPVPAPLTEEQLKQRVDAAVAAVHELSANPTAFALEDFSAKLRALGLPAVDPTPTPTYDPWTDPRLGATVALERVKFAARSITDEQLDDLALAVEKETAQEERWAAAIGILAAIAVRVGAAFAKV